MRAPPGRPRERASAAFRHVEREPVAGADPLPRALELALRHYENFPVLSRLVPPELRDPFAAVYAFARATDDLGDEGSALPGERLAALDHWERALDRVLADGAREDGVPAAVGAAARLIRSRGLSPDPFRALIEANRRDQLRSRYETLADLLESCALSANPVGRIVLALFGAGDPRLAGPADALCTGLQLANHWQGVGEDLRVRDRLYVPLEDLRRFGVAEDDLRRERPTRAVRDLLAFQLDRTRALLASAEVLPEAFPAAPRAVLRLFLRGGRAIVDELEARAGDLLRSDVRVPRRRRLLDLAVEALTLAVR
ncbi:MAG: squalene synthase HpnC [Gemmatimonadota bacterium]